VDVSALRLGIAVVLVGSGLGLLSKAGADIPPVVIAAVPVVLAAVLTGRSAIGALRRARMPAPSSVNAPTEESPAL
jgi:hypothetical protein